MKKKLSFMLNYCEAKLLKNKTDVEHIRKYLYNKKAINKKRVLNSEEVNKSIYNLIVSKKPFFVGRFGANELSAIKTFDFEVKSKYGKALKYLSTGAGFFPPTIEGGIKFKDLMISSIPLLDIVGIWLLPFEKYYLKKYAENNIESACLFDLEPWSFPCYPWSAALKGKKVLVVHPFAETILKQYKKRDMLFNGTNILPEFDLKVFKAVQTIAGERDLRFETWFDALDWMSDEIVKLDFDIAIVGCGAYGFPLSARIKAMGKQVIHLGGATQLLFGIKGKRWEDKDYLYVNRFFNEYWVFPSDMEKPKRASEVEGACYW